MLIKNYLLFHSLFYLENKLSPNYRTLRKGIFNPKLPSKPSSCFFFINLDFLLILTAYCDKALFFSTIQTF